MNDGGDQENDGKVVGVIEQLVVRLSKIDGNYYHSSESEPRKFSQRDGEIIGMDL